MEGLMTGGCQKLEAKVAGTMPLAGNSRRSHGSRWTLAPWVTRKRKGCVRMRRKTIQQSRWELVRLDVSNTGRQRLPKSQRLMIRRAPNVRHSASTHVMVITAPLFVTSPTRFCSFTPSSGGVTQYMEFTTFKIIK